MRSGSCGFYLCSFIVNQLKIKLSLTDINHLMGRKYTSYVRLLKNQVISSNKTRLLFRRTAICCSETSRLPEQPNKFTDFSGVNGGVLLLEYVFDILVIH